MKTITIKFYVILLSCFTFIGCSSNNNNNKQETIQKEESLSSETNKTWNGASSFEEFKAKLPGTIWHCNVNGMLYKFEFTTTNGVKKYSTRATSGKWNNKYIHFPSYTIEKDRDSNGKNQVFVEFGDDSNLDHVRQVLIFTDKCMKAYWGMRGNIISRVNYGDFEWSDEL